MQERKPKKVFVEGAISPQFIADSIAKHSSRTDIGAHSLFLGQVRADVIDQKQVTAIDYTAYAEMAEQALFTIREETFAKYPLTCMHIYHSLGRVLSGQICLFVFTSSVHRQAAVSACAELVERIKAEVPVWGKEIFDDNTTQWKINTP
ncbi:molybdenum cofactor biosynthesis protein MoaE [Sphingobacteriales bacterium UPWRP_1]|nr:molybdopterin converting factor [Sphingobacteriales bacterium TSM_CSM]PSJ73176.1 molybdenum cofactor biosynthesis protein MoaE [Sphingobacteriales bacterium UPWRP_1]